MVDFQQTVNIQPAPAVEGDFASANPRASVLAGPGGLIAGPGGVTVGRFAWVDPGDGITVTNTGAVAPTGFLARQGVVPGSLITDFLAKSTMLIKQGYGVTLWKEGDFWVKNNGTTEAVVGQKAFANFADGTVTFFAAGVTPPQAFSVTASIAATTGSFTGTITDNLLNITNVGSGVARPGGTLSGTGVASGTKIVEQLTGTTGGVGTYLVSIGGQSVTSTTISETYGTMTVTVVGSGTVSLNDTLVGGGGGGSNTVAGTRITQLGTGTGGTGTYFVDNNTVVTSGTIVGNGGIETKWQCQSPGAPGELVKISNVTINT